MVQAYFNHTFSPIIFELGPLKVRWYGVLYMSGFVICYFIFKKLIRDKYFNYPLAKLDNLIIYIVLGVILGARIFYVLIYDNILEHLKHPWTVFAIWQGGLSFHGSILGLLVAMFLVARKEGFSFWHIADAVVLGAPLGVGLGRIGNFMNGELWGRTTHVPWAFIFPYGGPNPRHPSQLYESFLEGFLIFTILWPLRKKVKKEGSIAMLFLILYGTFRFIIEFFREPDLQMGYYLNFFTMGQILCILMILSGLSLFLMKNRKYR